LQKRGKNKTNKYCLFSYKSKNICIFLNTKSKIITSYSIRFAKEKQLVYNFSSDNNFENKPLSKYNRVVFLQILDNFIRNESDY
jgi:hypothetical protein